MSGTRITASRVREGMTIMLVAPYNWWTTPLPVTEVTRSGRDVRITRSDGEAYTFSAQHRFTLVNP